MTENDPHRRDRIEPMQPAPMLREGQSGNGWLWLVSGAILVAIIITFFAVGANHSNNTAQNQAPNSPPPMTTGSGSTSPQSAQPPGRGAANAPPSGAQPTQR